MGKNNINKTPIRNRLTHHPNMRLLLAIAGIGVSVFGAITTLGTQGETPATLSASVQEYDAK